MSEINNNKINGYGYSKIDKVDKIEKPSTQAEKKPAEAGVKEQPPYVQDTGVLGRSLVKDAMDISRSVDDAVDIALNHPDIMEAGEKVFLAIYDDCKKRGMGPLEAAYIVSEAQKEFEEIAKANKAAKVDKK